MITRAWSQPSSARLVRASIQRSRYPQLLLQLGSLVREEGQGIVLGGECYDGAFCEEEHIAGSGHSLAACFVFDGAVASDEYLRLVECVFKHTGLAPFDAEESSGNGSFRARVARRNHICCIKDSN